MRIRRILKYLSNLKTRGRRIRKWMLHRHSRARNPLMYQHPNQPIQPEPARPAETNTRTRTSDIHEPLESIHKSYTTRSGVVIPPDFSYDRPKEVYQVLGPYPAPDGWEDDTEPEDDEEYWTAFGMCSGDFDGSGTTSEYSEGSADSNDSSGSHTICNGRRPLYLCCATPSSARNSDYRVRGPR